VRYWELVGESGVGLRGVGEVAEAGWE